MTVSGKPITIVVNPRATAKEMQSVARRLMQDKRADQAVWLQLPGKDIEVMTVGRLWAKYGGMN